VVVEVDSEYQGAVMQTLGSRKAEIKELKTTSSGTSHMEFIIAARALIGFRSDFLMMTRGTGVMYQNFFEYQPYKGDLPSRQTGVMISHTVGGAVAYALFNLQERGEIFIHHGDMMYEGMIIGVHNKGRDLVVNAIKGKKLTNVRAVGTDEAIQLIPPRQMTLEFALEFIDDDELVEITGKHIRLRKLYLNEIDRKRMGRSQRADNK